MNDLPPVNLDGQYEHNGSTDGVTTNVQCVIAQNGAEIALLEAELKPLEVEHTTIADKTAEVEVYFRN
jgi:hypothetical protein